ncbi:MAG: type II toxin-antitoxin system VapC family toxin [Betaproteobacteria bacterium]|nr:type II toxin-antitoxin system VapC family toxin [Betaproteobacteria bacterium]
MVVDTSALLAILQDEPERHAIADAIERAEARRVSAANFVEASVVLDARHGAEGIRMLDRLLEIAAIDVVPVDVQQARLARDGWHRFGKGRHPAGLNFGDCFAYALAMSLREPLLYKGEDFARTDVASALAAPAA